MPKQDVKVELFYNGVWNELVGSNDVYINPIKITCGQSEEGASLRPQRVTFTLANDDEKFRPSNPLSPLYGLVGRNTPCRVTVAGSIRCVGEASFEPDQTDDFRVSPKRGKAWVDVDAAGLLQRIGQWTEPLESPMYQYSTTSIANMIGYWPMEDERGTIKPFSPVEGARVGYTNGHSFQSDIFPPGSGPVVERQSGGQIVMYSALSPDNNTGWEASVLLNQDALDGGFSTPIFMALVDGRYVSFSLDDDIDNTVILISEYSGATITQVNNSFPAGFTWSGRWLMLTMKATYSAPTTTIAVTFQGVDDDFSYTVTATYNQPPSLPYYTYVSAVAGSTYGHVTTTVGHTTDLHGTARFAAFQGYSGETAAERFNRLCILKGISGQVTTTWASSRRVGPQAVDTLTNLFQELITTEDAIIHDRRSDVGLFFRDRRSRHTQSPAVTLDVTDLATFPREVLNDLDPHNYVNVNNRFGGFATAIDSTSSMGTPLPPAGVGEYRQDLDICIPPGTEKPVLAQTASWYLNKGTNPNPRFPQITVDLGAKPGLTTAVAAVGVGDVIEITGAREYTIRLNVIGYEEVIGTHTRVITFTCGLDGVFDGGRYSNGVHRYGSRGCTLNAGITSSATSLTVKFPKIEDAWSRTNNFSIIIAGEVINVLAANVSAVSGSLGAYTQTFTGVTRAANGISKAQAAGAAVAVWNKPGRWMLGV